MAKTPARAGQPWTSEDVKHLKQLAKENTPTRVAALKLERTTSAVQNKASAQGISLRPTNQSPYGTKNR